MYLVRHALAHFDHFAKTPTHEALDAGHGVFRVDHSLALGYLAHQSLVSLGERNHRREQAAALLRLDDGRFAALKHGYQTLRIVA
jgi:hypothetical protein